MRDSFNNSIMWPKIRNLWRTAQFRSHAWKSWLDNHRLERMDATKRDVFDPARCDFHLDRYDFACRFSSGLHVADIACGTGYGSSQLSRFGNAASVVGIDTCSKTIAYARRFHSAPHVRYLSRSAYETGLANSSIDLIVSFETIEHVELEDKLLSEFYRLLKTGGHLILSTPNDWGLDRAPFHVRSYDAFQLCQAVREEFRVLSFFNQNSGCMQRVENRGQQRGIRESTPDILETAECFIVVAEKGDDGADYFGPRN